MCLDLREKANEDPTFISRIITGNESWIYGYDPEKNAPIVTVEEPRITKSKKGAAGLEFNKEHVHCYFRREGILHHDMPAHTSLKTTEFVTNNMVIVPHPHYSLDLDPCDFALFPQIENETEGTTF
jgi:hypothetical protein